MIGYGIAFRAMQHRRNIVTEMTGGVMSFDEYEGLIEAMLSVGYKPDIVYIHCDLESAQQRNLSRGVDSISAYYTERYHARWLLQTVGEIRGMAEG